MLCQVRETTATSIELTNIQLENQLKKTEKLSNFAFLEIKL